MTSKLDGLRLEPLGELSHRRDRADPHHPRRNARRGVAENAGDRLKSMRFRRFARGDDQRRGAVVDAGGVARRHAAALAHDAAKPGQRFEGRVGARVLIRLDAGHAPFAILDLDRDDFLPERPFRLGRRGALLRAQRERVLVGARNLIFVGDVLGRLRHRIDAVKLLHRRIDEAPADGGVENVRRPLKRRLSLAHDERGAGHQFGAAGDRELNLARLDPPRRRGDRLHARGAKAVDGCARNGLGQAGEQERHAREIAVVLARLVGAAEKDLVELLAEAGMAAHELADRRRREIVGAHAGQRAAVAADRRAHIVADEGLGHGRGSRRFDLKPHSAIVASVDRRLV